MKKINKEYFLDKRGIITLLNSISQVFKNAITNLIIRGETKIPTSKAVEDFVDSREELKIIQDIPVITEDPYNLEQKITTYNGKDSAEIVIHLVSALDIQNLFDNE